METKLNKMCTANQIKDLFENSKILSIRCYKCLSKDVLLDNELNTKFKFEINIRHTEDLEKDILNSKNFYDLVKINNTTITKDNIHLYYEFMSDDDLEKYKQILNSIFTDRYSYLYDKIKIKLDMLEIKTLFGSFHVGLKLFKIKDTLKPIDEYIEEIRASSEYKEYIKNKQ